MQQQLQSGISSNQKKPINYFPMAKIILFSKFKPFLKIVPRKVSVMQTEFEIETILFAINTSGNTFQFVLSYQWGFPGGLVVKSPPANAGDTDSIPELKRSPGEENGSPLQYSCRENSTDRRAWWATVHRVAKSQTQLND